MITEILLIISLILLVILIFLVIRGKGVTQADLKHAISSTWIELGLGEVKTHAEEIKKSYKSFEQMLRVPIERGSLGETFLEELLSKQLPPDMYGIRKEVISGKRPDAHIRSTVGIICIDSKFPLDNYGKMLLAEGSSEGEKLKRDFIDDVRGHLDKVSNDYVCPDKGTAEFAFAYIPSESVYYFLVNEANDMLRSYTGKGVQVVSPLTLSHKIELIKSGVHAKRLSENAEKVKNDLIRLSKAFAQVDKEWRIFYETHLKNVREKASDLDEAYRKLRDEFEKISKVSEEG